MVVWMIDTYGDDTQRETWLPPLTAMQEFGGYCLTEPGVGSDAANVGPVRSARATTTCSPG